jgi:hypothetical protein
VSARIAYWPARLMPAQLMELMRHESIETTLRFYVGTDAQRTAEAAWAAFEAVQRVFGGPFANSATSGGGDAAPPERRSVPANTVRNQTRPGVIRTHDQGIMSPLLSPLSYGPEYLFYRVLPVWSPARNRDDNWSNHRSALFSGLFLIARPPTRIPAGAAGEELVAARCPRLGYHRR